MILLETSMDMSDDNYNAKQEKNDFAIHKIVCELDLDERFIIR